MRRVDAQVEAKLHAKNELEACVLGLGLGLGSRVRARVRVRP